MLEVICEVKGREVRGGEWQKGEGKEGRTRQRKGRKEEGVHELMSKEENGMMCSKERNYKKSAVGPLKSDV